MCEQPVGQSTDYLALNGSLQGPCTVIFIKTGFHQPVHHRFIEFQVEAPFGNALSFFQSFEFFQGNQSDIGDGKGIEKNNPIYPVDELLTEVL